LKDKKSRRENVKGKVFGRIKTTAGMCANERKKRAANGQLNEKQDDTQEGKR
jgi:hypothetical protein